MIENSKTAAGKNGADFDERNKCVFQNLGLVKSIALRFQGRGYELEDLIEIGTIGLLKAVDGFDESLGYRFSTYAFPLITGEIKRFLRDDGIIKISRETKKNSRIVLKAREDYIKENGKEPTFNTLKELCSLSAEQITEALCVSSPVLSLGESINGDNENITINDTVGTDDTISALIEKTALKQALFTLSDFERELIHLRYFKNLTQTQTAKIMNITQVKVSRYEKKTIEKLKREFIS